MFRLIASIGSRRTGLIRSHLFPSLGVVPGNRTGYSIISNIPPSNEPEPEPTSLKDRLKHFFKKYGKLGIAVYLGVSVVTFSSSYLALRSGLDLPGLLIKLGVPEKEWMKNAGTFAFAYALYKLALPLRLFVTVGLTGYISRRFRLGGAYKNVDPKVK